MGLLADTFRDRLAGFLAAHNPTRVLVGGLPDSLIERIATTWNAPYHLFLVSNTSTAALPNNVQRCRADDLTAERQHGWAAVVSAHESRRVQESIRSAGAGTVREVWASGFPWHPCDLPGVRWPDIRGDWITRLGLDLVEPAAAKCIDQFREELRGEVDAGLRFFSALDNLTSSLASYDDLSFQLGFPSHKSGRTLRKRGDKECVLARLDLFVEMFKDEVADEALEQLVHIAKTRYDNDPATLYAVTQALKYFADEFRHIPSADAENSVRTWRSVFAQNRIHWESLSDSVLAELVGSHGEKPAFAQYVLSSGNGLQLIQVGENHVLARDRNVAAPELSGTFEFTQGFVNAAARDAGAGLPWRLFAGVNRAFTILSSPVPMEKGPHNIAVPFPNEGKQIVHFLAGPTTANQQAKLSSLTIWECCQDFPLIVASAHSKTRAGKRRRSKDASGNVRFEVEQDLSLPSQGRIALHGFIYHLRANLNVVLPGADSAGLVSGLSPVPNSLCHQFVLNIDAADGGEVAFSWTDSKGNEHSATISIAIKGEPGPREDSITGLLLHAHNGASGRYLKEHLKVLKKGLPLPPDELPLKETVKQIALLEYLQQESDTGWWPILVSEDVDIRDQKILPHTSGHLLVSSNLRLNNQANAWLAATSSTADTGAVPAEIERYATARTKILGALKRQFDLASGGSIDEVNLARRGVVGLLSRDLLTEYVAAYRDLLRGINSDGINDPWRWHAWCLDSVLLFRADASAPTTHLLGPYHPITLVRLFYLQLCLGERLIEDQYSPLAQIFAQAQPLALGHVLDAKLQPAYAIGFPTGEPHWLWLYRQQGQSNLPEEELVEWLRRTGLDPEAGPWGVDAEVLPQTLNQYILAYPSRQTIRLLLEDCSQRTFEVLRDSLIAEEDPIDTVRDNLRLKLPGGLSVYDPITRVKRLDGELLSYDPELPIRWHHGKPPSSLPLDVATLQRSNLVDFQAKARGGSYSDSVPTARRGLVEFSASGLEIATAIDPTGKPNGLESAFTDLLSLFEPSGQQLSWGTSLSATSSPKANWTLCSAGQVDPRLFIEYVRKNPGTALWTYRLYSVGTSKTPEFGRGHYLITKISQSLANGLQTHLAATGLAVSPKGLLVELAEAGLTLGDEFLRTGRTAEGAMGQYLVESLIWQPAGDLAPLPHWTAEPNGKIAAAGFLLQVDPFRKLLDTFAELLNQGRTDTDLSPVSHQRSDLVSIHLQICGDELWIRPVVLESKFLQAGSPDIEGAVAQASATASLFDKLLDFCQIDFGPRESFWAQPERLLLSELIHLGLRVARGSFSGGGNDWHDFERSVLSRVLSGRFRRDDARAIAVIHHNGSTVNNLSNTTPHVFVSFADSNAARTGVSPQKYLEIQQTLAAILRHVCGQPSSTEPPPPQSPVIETPVEKELPRIITISSKPPTTELLQKILETPPDRGPLIHTEAAISEAHDAFDAAFSDFIGNKQAVEKLRDDLVDALIKRPPHLASAYLLTGNPSTGKTTLANKVARLLGVTFVKLVGTNIRNGGDLVKQVENAFHAADRKPSITEMGSQGVPEYEYPECLIFIDEIHLVKGHAQEDMLTLTEAKDRYIRLSDRICRFPRATYMAATTRASEIDKALQTRFGNPIHLSDYKSSEVAEMLRVKASTWAAWSETIRLGIAQLSRRIPREAERLAKKLERKLTVSREKHTIESALEKLRLEEGLDRNGLDQVCWAVLRHLAKQTRPLGKEPLAKQLGSADEDRLVYEIIPSLTALGLVEQVPGGQIATDRGRNYLRNESPPA